MNDHLMPLCSPSPFGEGDAEGRGRGLQAANRVIASQVIFKRMLERI
jgi:hypothetical protein